MEGDWGGSKEGLMKGRNHTPPGVQLVCSQAHSSDNHADRTKRRNK